MTNHDRIRTPWTHKWRRFRYSALPAVCFACSVVLTAWLWQRQGELPNAVGALEWVDVPVPAGADGKLTRVGPEVDPKVDPKVADRSWQRFDQVNQGDLIALLDDTAVVKSQQTLEKELEQLRRELDAELERARGDQGDRQHDHQREARRLARELLDKRLDVLDRRAEIESDRIQLRRFEAMLALYKSLVRKDPPIVNQQQVDDVQLQRDEVQKRIDENLKALTEADSQLASAQEAHDNYPPLAMANVNALLAPVSASIAVQEARIEELKLQAKDLEIRSPIKGTIQEVHYLAGQYVREGDPIVTIAGAATKYIISYVQQGQRFRPQPGMPVDVRVRSPGARAVEATVYRVGAEIVRVPNRLLRDPRVSEWGLPVQIKLSSALPVFPGELVDVKFNTVSRKKAD